MIFNAAITFFLSFSAIVALPAPHQEPVFTVNGRPKSTSPYFNGQHIYGNAPNVPGKPKNTIILPDQHVNLQPTASGNLQSTHPVAVQEFKKGVPQPPRAGYVKVAQGKYGDINHFAATLPCKRSPAAPCTLSPRVVNSLSAEARGASRLSKVATGLKFGSAIGKAGRLAAGPEGMIASAAIDNAILGYQTSSKYNAMMKNGGRDYERAHMMNPYAPKQVGLRGRGGAGMDW